MNFTNTDRKWFNQVYWRMTEYGQVYMHVNDQVEDQVRGQVKCLMFVQIIPIQNKIKEKITL
jgi:hypothetical protein